MIRGGHINIAILGVSLPDLFALTVMFICLTGHASFSGW